MIIYLHIGTHKTGSTSVQQFLAEHRSKLAQYGIEFYRGAIIDANHIELYLSALDKNKDFLALASLNVGSLSELRDKTLQEVGGFLNRTNASHVIFSSEGLSLLRTPEELAELKNILGGSKYFVKVVCFLRDKSDFLKAYEKQIRKVPGRVPSTDPSSSLYVESDSWLADFDSLLASYARAFGEENIITIDYDRVTKETGDILPEVLGKLGVVPNLIPKAGTYKEAIERLG